MYINNQHIYKQNKKKIKKNKKNNSIKSNEQSIYDTGITQVKEIVHSNN